MCKCSEKTDFSYLPSGILHGCAFTNIFNIEGEIWLTNGEYSTQVYYCPICGEKAEKEPIKEIYDEVNYYYTTQKDYSDDWIKKWYELDGQR